MCSEPTVLNVRQMTKDILLKTLVLDILITKKRIHLKELCLLLCQTMYILLSPPEQLIKITLKA